MMKEANPIANLMVGMLSTLAEFELTRLKERAREGIATTGHKYAGREAEQLRHRKILSKPKTKEIIKYLKAGECT
jgi:DNA invertase Pin-like site-specific DNA recombinase